MWKFSWSYIVLNMFCYVLCLKLAKFPLHSIAFKKDLLGGELQIPESKAVTSFHPGHFSTGIHRFQLRKLELNYDYLEEKAQLSRVQVAGK